jgi:GntR family transcriptional regulator
VAEELRAKILAGTLANGARLPSLSALATQNAVTTDIAREAIAALRAERLVITKHGAGTFVSRFALIVRRSPERLATTWSAGRTVQDHDTGPRPRTVDVVVNEVKASELVAAALGVPVGERVLSRSRRFLVENRPVQLATSYLPLDLVKGTAITYTDAGPGGTYARLAEIGHRPARFTERVRARAPHPAERDALQLPATTGLVFEITRTAYDEQDRCVEVNSMILDAEAYELEYGFTL